MTGKALMAYSKNQISLIQRLNPELEPVELDALVEYSKRAELDLFRKQLSAIVFGAKAKDRSKRRVAYVVGIDGYRAMADRTGCYAPSAQPPLYTYDGHAKGPANPKGIVSCTVAVKKYAQGTWHEYSATAFWDEFCVVEEEWTEGEDGRRRPSGKKKAGSAWERMPHVMIAKVAEAQALRRGWPDTFSGLYSEDEIERERVLDLTASEVVEEARAEERLAKIGGAKAVLIDWLDGGAIERVPDGAFVDRVTAWINDADRAASEIRVWMDRNRHGLQDFWSREAGDALELKKLMEQRVSELAAKEAKEAAE